MPATIKHIYTTSYKSKSQPPGFADFVIGSMSLFCFNEQSLYVDYSNHPINNFLVNEYKNCISALDNYYDVVGCNYSNDLKKECFAYTVPFPKPHYNGNFWWANSNYLRNLSPLSTMIIDRNAPEFWLFKNNPAFYNMHSSNVNHYHSEYPKIFYEMNV